MDYINDALARVNLYQICSFLLSGVECGEDEVFSYADTLKKDSDPIYRRLDVLCPDATERDRASADLSQALAAYESVYMELGMKAGARLIHQLLFKDDRLPDKKTAIQEIRDLLAGMDGNSVDLKQSRADRRS